MHLTILFDGDLLDYACLTRDETPESLAKKICEAEGFDDYTILRDTGDKHE